MIRTVTILILLIVFFLAINIVGMLAQLRFAGVSLSGAYSIGNESVIGFPNYPIKNFAFVQEGLLNADIHLLAEYNLFGNVFAGMEIGYYRLNMRLNGYEPITVIIDKNPIDGAILHKLDVGLNLVYPSVYVGYGFGGLSFAVGNRFDFNVSGSYSSTERIIKPDSLYFINAKTTGQMSFSNVNNPVYMPFVGIRYDFGEYLFGGRAYTMRVGVEYSFAINSLAKNYTIKTSSIKLGIDVGFDFINEGDKIEIVRDTVYYRDTVVAFSYDMDSLGTKLIRTEVERKQEGRDLVIRERSVIREHYSRKIRKPRALLNGELRTVFVTPEGEEMQECVLEYSGLVVNRHFPNGNGSNFTKEGELINNVEIPIIRFYTSIISEAGLDSAIISLYSSGKGLAEIVKTGEDWSYVDFNIDSLINPEFLKPLYYKLTLIDLDGQRKITATGEILLKSKQTNTIATTEIYYISLNDDNRTINNLIGKVEQASKGRAKACYYSEQIDVRRHLQIEAIASKYSGVKFEKVNANLFRRRYFVAGKRVEDYLVFVIKQ